MDASTYVCIYTCVLCLRPKPFSNKSDEPVLHYSFGIHSHRFQTLLRTNSAVFKQESIYSEFFYPLLVPYIHYIPVKADLSDLIPTLSTWLQRSTDLQVIATEAQKFAVEMLSPAAILCYMHQMVVHYSTQFVLDI